MQKIILVTGANKGIGFEMVRQLGRAGHTVLLGARDTSKGAEAVDQLQRAGVQAELLHLDITDVRQLVQAAGYVREKYSRLDVLMNNAAILLKTDHHLSQDDDVFNRTMLTNVHAQREVTSYFLPLMPRGARIIMTSSGGGSMSDPVGGWSPAYCVSKSALNALTRHLAYELQHRSIQVNAFCPGWVRTDMGGKSAPRSVEQGADTGVWLASGDVTATGKFYRDRKIIPW
jgi:NAD(P)-dependent dehydrogenase (short-subunit alcohol dehydrogenase family)